MKVGIVGATAYTSRDLIGILVRHPEAELVYLGGRREERPRISELFPELKGICDARLQGLGMDEVPDGLEVAFFTLPHGVSQDYVPRFLDSGVRCIDFSADYRLDDLEVYRAWYGEHRDPQNVDRAVYGLPELTGKALAGAALVANPGCYPTAVTLGLAPLVRAGLVDSSDVLVDAKSGVSGRGNKPTVGSMYCECNEDVRAYKVGGHRHEPEMERALRLAGAENPKITFVPHLVPMDRGILATMVAPLTRAADNAELRRTVERFYADQPFIRVRSAEEQPRTKAVAFTNYCDLAVAARRGEKAIITSAIDNLMKGAASQAVQNMNVMFGLDQTTGLL